MEVNMQKVSFKRWFCTGQVMICYRPKRKEEDASYAIFTDDRRISDVLALTRSPK